MNTQFDKIKDLVYEYDEIKRFLNSLENNKNLIAVIQSDYDGPGVNYTTYSDKCKQLVLSVLKTRMEEISKQFN